MTRTERIQARVTPSEKARIEARALAAGMKVSEYLVHRALGKPIKRIRRLSELPLLTLAECSCVDAEEDCAVHGND